MVRKQENKPKEGNNLGVCEPYECPIGFEPIWIIIKKHEMTSNKYRANNPIQLEKRVEKFEFGYKISDMHHVLDKMIKINKLRVVLEAVIKRVRRARQSSKPHKHGQNYKIDKGKSLYCFSEKGKCR